ncbi:hypothetical protein [Streptosporangium amethystogenes]|uniref:hypothetical protein n=1 Tax=Streptosporangium amethystogenes TaxID=2002 RepID=UPI0004C69E54|nr:hypothetical protein [Streptosporangium amethystogenes]
MESEKTADRLLGGDFALLGGLGTVFGSLQRSSRASATAVRSSCLIALNSGLPQVHAFGGEFLADPAGLGAGRLSVLVCLLPAGLGAFNGLPAVFRSLRACSRSAAQSAGAVCRVAICRSWSSAAVAAWRRSASRTPCRARSWSPGCAKARQIRSTLVGEIPTCLAGSRFDQCVAPAGTSSKVRTTTSSTWRR